MNLYHFPIRFAGSYVVSGFVRHQLRLSLTWFAGITARDVVRTRAQINFMPTPTLWPPVHKPLLWRNLIFAFSKIMFCDVVAVRVLNDLGMSRRWRISDVLATQSPLHPLQFTVWEAARLIFLLRSRTDRWHRRSFKSRHLATEIAFSTPGFSSKIVGLSP